MKIVLVDRNSILVGQWRQRCSGVEVYNGSIFDYPCDAVVSPANSFGFMDGGIDFAYSEHFGWHVQETLQRKIIAEFGGELLVGQATSVETGHPDFPALISAPTMRVPKVIDDPFDVFLATRSALREAKRIGAGSIAFPGMGTGCGRVKEEWAASMMAAAITDFVSPPDFPPDLKAASARHYEPFLWR